MKEDTLSVERTMRWCVALSALALGAGCASSDLPGEVPEAPVREGQERPGDPTTEDTDLPYDEDAGGGSGELDAGGGDNNPTEDGGEGGDDVGDTDCGELICSFGETRCVGEQVEACEPGINGCPRWGAPTTCQGEEVCVAGQCDIVNGCVDGDLDGYGPGCINGPDCDDADSERNSGRIEVCDGKDNDCNGMVDDGVPGVGDACTSGQGTCETTGLTVCDASGLTVCDAQPDLPTAEVCDGLDNDCNGTPDDGIMCMGPACGDDRQEPNESISSAYLLAPETPIIGFTCQTDLEFYTLDTTPGVTYRVNLAFPHNLSDLDLILYEDGVEVDRADSASDHEQLVFTPRAGSVYTAEVDNFSGNDNYHRLVVTSDWDCTSEDEFSPNQNATTAAPILPNILLPAHMCSGSEDWYFLGEVVAGDTVNADTFCPTFSCFGSDIDINLYSNYDNDLMLELEDTGGSLSVTESASFTATGTTDVWMRVTSVFGSTNYDVGWYVL